MSLKSGVRTTLLKRPYGQQISVRQCYTAVKSDAQTTFLAVSTLLKPQAQSRAPQAQLTGPVG